MTTLIAEGVETPQGQWAYGVDDRDALAWWAVLVLFRVLGVVRPLPISGRKIDVRCAHGNMFGEPAWCPWPAATDRLCEYHARPRRHWYRRSRWQSPRRGWMRFIG